MNSEDFNVNTRDYSEGNHLNIAVDFDDTYTLNPVMWNEIIKILFKSNFNVYCVTARPDDHMKAVYEALDGVVPRDMIINTSLRCKRDHLRKHHNIHIHVWIDDTPDAIVSDFYDSAAEL